MSDEQIVRLIAEKAMGWLRCQCRPDCIQIYDGYACRTSWNPLTSIADAFMAVEKIGGIDLIKVDAGWMAGDGSGGFTTDGGYVETQLANFAIAETPARAISLAIYAAVEGEKA